MRGLVIEREEGPDSVVLRTLPEPAGDGLVIGVKAAGVGFPDLLMSQGKFQIRQPPPFTLGWEASGEVLNAPAGSPFAVGQDVVTLSLGAHAEMVEAVPEATFPLPGGMSVQQGAIYPLNYLTAHAALIRRGRLKAGETVLIQGAAGGLGTAAIQVAKGTGSRVLAVVSTEAKAETATAAGADEVFLTGDDWRTQVLEASGGGVNVALDPVGGDRFGLTLKCMASEGRLVVVGFTDGSIPEVATNRLLFRNVDVCGCTWSVLATEPTGLADAAAALGRMVDAGHVSPISGETYELADGAAALREIEARAARGKAALVVS